MNNSERYSNYRSLLRDELKVRKDLRSSVSMNTFARLLGLTPGHLNDLFKERRGLSESKASTIADKLNLSDYDREFFLTSVRSLHARARRDRESAATKMSELKQQEISILKPDLFALISQWQHFAILELVRFADFQNDAKWIAKKLNIEVSLAKSSIERLMRLDLLRYSSEGWKSHQGFQRTNNDIPSAAIKSHHAQILNLAKDALTKQDVAVREYGANIFAIDRRKVALAKKRIREFQIEMSELLTTSSKTRDALYCLGIQFFSLDDSTSR